MEKMNKIKNFLNDIELHMASVAICITTVLVISNVFFRYGLGQQFLWTEEVALGGFVWTVYLGSVAAYNNYRACYRFICFYTQCYSYLYEFYLYDVFS